MNVLPEALELLTSRVDALEKRVHDLEHSVEACAPPEMRLVTVASDIASESAIEQANGVFPVLGGAMLGIAGAYVLRAFAESSLVPRPAIAAVAIAYAAAWLVWASRTRATANFVRAVYAGTAALILAPMLWELTLRFNVLSPALAAAVLSGFVIAGTALAWKRDLTPIFWMAHGAAALTSVALCIGTHEFMPFIFSLLLMVLLSEFAAIRGRGQSIRLLVAAVADVAVWALIFIYSGPQNVRADYPALGTVALLAPAYALFFSVLQALPARPRFCGERYLSSRPSSASSRFCSRSPACSSSSRAEALSRWESRVSSCPRQVTGSLSRTSVTPPNDATSACLLPGARVFCLPDYSGRCR